MLIGGEQPIPAVKLVMLGNSGVGKSSLINSWITGSCLASPKPTIGAVTHMQRLTINEQEMDLFLWDTAGQEQFFSLSPLYVRNTSVAIIVADLSDQSSFDKIMVWRDTVIDINNKDTPIVLAINKIDLGQEVFSRDEINTKFSSLFSSIFYVSAQRYLNVEAMFYEAAGLGLRYVLSEKTKSNKFMITVDEDKKQEHKCCK